MTCEDYGRSNKSDKETKYILHMIRKFLSICHNSDFTTMTSILAVWDGAEHYMLNVNIKFMQLNLIFQRLCNNCFLKLREQCVRLQKNLNA